MSTASYSLARRPALLSEFRERPSLLVWELCWRWCCGGFLLCVVGYDAMRIWTASAPAVRATGIFTISGDSLLSNPAQLSSAVMSTVGIVRPQVEHAIAGLAPLGIFCWIAAFGFGRAAIMARYDRRLARRGWLLAECEALRLGALFAASFLWGVFLHVASALTLRGGSPSLLLYVLLVLVISAVLLAAWTRVAKTVELTMAVGLSEALPLRAAFHRAWRVPHQAAALRVRQVRKAAQRMRIYFFGGALLLTVLPAPVAAGWALVAWWVAISLVTLAAADALRLGVQFALIAALREAGVSSFRGEHTSARP